jgi:glycosyltransferase involved in cell wall biosynthesis
LPVRNGERYVGEAIRSILDQDVELELVIGDNGSTDATEEICRDLAADDRRVRYFRSAVNHGAAWNFNRLVPLARGKWFKWAAHDDVCGPHCLRLCVQRLQADPAAALAYPRTVFIDASGDVLDGAFGEDLVIEDSTAPRRFRRYVGHPGEQHATWGVIRRDLLAQTTLIANCWGGDIVLLAQLALGGTFLQVPEPLFLRRYHPDSSMVANASPVEVARWFDPTRLARTALPRTRLTVELLRVIARADLSWRERLECYDALAVEWLPRYGRVMGGEVKITARSAFDARFRRAKNAGMA